MLCIGRYKDRSCMLHPIATVNIPNITYLVLNICETPYKIAGFLDGHYSNRAWYILSP